MKRIVLSLVSISALATLCAEDNITEMFSNGKVSGQVREFSISRSVEDSRSAKKDYTRTANAIGGHLKFETADYNGVSMGTAFYTTSGFGLDDNKTDYTEVDPTLLGSNNESYSILGEAYLNLKYGNTSFKGGRQKLNTPLAGADDVRMTPNFFEAYLLVNSDIKDTTLILAHASKFAQGTFGRAYDGEILSATGGYSAVDSRDQVNHFVNMGKYAVGKDTDGVSIASITYKGFENFKFQLWDYYAHDILNAIYADVSYSWTCLLTDKVKPFAAAQIVKENAVGDKYLSGLGGDGEIDSLYYGMKFGFKIENFTTYIAYSKTTENDSSDAAYANAIISPWGSMPAYTQGMVTRHVFLAGTAASKIAASYNFKNFGADIKTVAYYASYDMADYNGYTENDASEAGFDIIYSDAFMENLQLRFRGNFSNDFYVKETNTDTTFNGNVDWSEYRFIANYSF